MKLHLWAATALARADLPAEALDLLQAPGVAKFLADEEEVGNLLAQDFAVGATAAAQLRAGEIDAARATAASIFETPPRDLEEAEILGARALILAASTAHGDILPSDILFGAFLIELMGVWGGLPFTYPDYQERVDALRRAMLDNPVAQEVLSEARQQIKRTIQAAGADEATGLQDILSLGLDMMVLLRQFTDATFAASQVVERDSAQTEALASASIRVTNHTDLALTLALLGDLDGARRSLALAHAAAMEYPATGARKHGSEGIGGIGGVSIR